MPGGNGKAGRHGISHSSYLTPQKADRSGGCARPHQLGREPVSRLLSIEHKKVKRAVFPSLLQYVLLLYREDRFDIDRDSFQQGKGFPHLPTHLSVALDEGLRTLVVTEGLKHENLP